MRLDINKSYIIYTTSDYIVNKQVRILGYINYDRASQYQSFVENIAINEKFIDKEFDNTVDYLKKQIYYDCCVIEYVDGEYKPTDEHLILWDDIIDGDRTERLFEDFNYDFKFKFKNIGVSDNINKDLVINIVKHALEEKFGNKIEFSLNEHPYESSNIENQLAITKNLLEKSKDTLTAFINLEKSAKSINSQFLDNNIVDKVIQLNTNIDDIKNSTDVILANLK